MPFALSMPSWTYDSTSPYPPSSPSNSELECEGLSHSMAYLRSSVAVLPDSKLRTLILKLADKDPHFQRAVMKELSHTDSDGSVTTPTTPTPARHRRAHRKPRRKVKNLSISTRTPHAPLVVSQVNREVEYLYHPGHLEEEIYEFISVRPDETSPHVVRKIAMWSCCDEDEWSSGCVSAAAFPLHLQPRSSSADDFIESRHADVLPDSDVERR